MKCRPNSTCNQSREEQSWKKKEPIMVFNPKRVEVNEGTYAESPYAQLTLAHKTPHVCHDQCKTGCL